MHCMVLYFLGVTVLLSAQQTNVSDLLSAQSQCILKQLLAARRLGMIARDFAEPSKGIPTRF